MTCESLCSIVYAAFSTNETLTLENYLFVFLSFYFFFKSVVEIKHKPTKGRWHICQGTEKLQVTGKMFGVAV